ncbi:hypothetical protein BD289DRAFT_361586, partial [Coniella lustricola]
PGEVVDGSGCTLLPGLIGSHVHVLRTADLDKMAAAGVTTAMDMASWPPSLTASLRDASRDTKADSSPRPVLYSAGILATGPNSRHSQLPDLPKEALLTSPDQAEAFVIQRISEGSEYIKLVADDVPGCGPSQETLDALVHSAAARDKKTVVHAAAYEGFRKAVACGADCVTHLPKDQVVDAEWAKQLAAQKRVVCPTLVTMKTLISNDDRRPDFGYCLASLKILVKAGVQILAGTDAVDAPFMQIEHGTSMHQELVLMREAGIEDVDVLRSATSLPAQFWALEGRGAIRPQAYADLLLVRGEPDRDIKHIAHVEGVWIGGRKLGGERVVT